MDVLQCPNAAAVARERVANQPNSTLTVTGTGQFHGTPNCAPAWQLREWRNWPTWATPFGSMAGAANMGVLDLRCLRLTAAANDRSKG